MPGLDGKNRALRFVNAHHEKILREARVARAQAEASERKLHRSILELLTASLAGEPLEIERVPHLDLTDNFFGVLAAVDAVGSGIQRVQGSRHGYDPGHDLIDQCLLELRSEIIRRSPENGSKTVPIDVFQHFAQAMFSVHRCYLLVPLNDHARRVVSQKAGSKCYQVLFSRSEPCRVCPLERVLDQHQTTYVLGELGIHRMSPMRSDLALLALEEFGSGEEPTSTSSMSRAVLDSVASGVLMLDAEGCIVHANARARELIGPLMGRQRIDELLEGFVLNEDGHQREIAPRGGGTRILGYRSLPCVVDGEPHRIVALRDLTELGHLRTSVDRMQRLSEVGQLCASVAHEIRNPLAGIMATIQSIERPAAAAGLGDSMETIQSEIRRLGDMLNGFFAFMRWQPPHRRMTDMGLVLQRAAHALGPRLQEIKILPKLEELSPIWVDPDQLQQLLINLLLNASDAMRGKGEILVRMFMDDDHFFLSVKDEGCGIAPENLERVFDAFFTTKPQGAGLGLAVCHRIVAAHEGVMKVESQVGRGTWMNVTLPIKRLKP